MRSIPNMDFQIANQPVNIDRENDELQKIYRWINELSWLVSKNLEDIAAILGPNLEIYYFFMISQTGKLLVKFTTKKLELIYRFFSIHFAS